MLKSLLCLDTQRFNRHYSGSGATLHRWFSIVVCLAVLSQTLVPVLAAGQLPAAKVPHPGSYLPVRLRVDVDMATPVDANSTVPGATSHPAIQTAPGAAAHISMLIEPSTMPADGQSQAQVLAFVSDAEGNPVANGTPVALTTTGGRLSPDTGWTREGMVQVTLTAPYGAGRSRHKPAITTRRLRLKHGAATARTGKRHHYRWQTWRRPHNRYATACAR